MRRVVSRVGFSNSFFLQVHVAAVVNAPEETSINSTLVHDDGIFLIVTAVAKDSDDGVLTSREFAKFELLRGTCGSKGFLWVVQDVGHRVHSNQEVREVDTHGLFTHSRLVGITRRLQRCN